MKQRKTNIKSILFLSLLVLISCMFVFHKFLFGNQILAYTDIGSDTAAQYLMHYQTIINQLRDGSASLWDFSNGVGINMYSLNLFDPFLMILYGLGTVLGGNQIYELLVYMQIVRMLLAGIVVYCYLSCFCLSESSKVMGAYLYAFCGFMVVWGQHYQFGTIAILFPLLLLMAEKSFEKKGWYLGITISCALVSLCSMYFGYMQLLTLGFYAMYRVAWNGRLFSKAGMKRLGAIYGSMILGIGMGMFQLLPTAMMIFGVSGRMGGEPLLTRIINACKPYDKAYYITLLKRFFSSNLQGTNVFSGYQNYYEAPNVFFSVLLIIAVFQFVYLICKKDSRLCMIGIDKEHGFDKAKQRKRLVLIITACLTGAFLLLVPLGSLIYNGFAYPFSRHTFVCMPFFALLTAWVMEEIYVEKRGSLLLLMTASLGSIGLYARVYTTEGNKLALIMAAFTLFLTVCIMIAWKGKKSLVKKMSFLGTFLCLMGMMSCDAYYSFSVGRLVLEKAPSSYMDEMYDESLQAALQYLEETDLSFYRVEKDYNVGTASDCLNALAQDYNGISSYNSTLNSDTARFFVELWPNVMFVNNDHYSFANAEVEYFQSALLNVKYVISKSADFDAPGYQMIKQFDDLYLYQNMQTKDIGKFYTKVITSETISNMDASVDKQKVLTEYAICDTLQGLETNEFSAQPVSDAIIPYQKNCITESVQIHTYQNQGIFEIQVEQLPAYDSQKVIHVTFDLLEHQAGLIYAEVNEDHMNLFSENPINHVTLILPKDCNTIRIFDGVLGEASPFRVENIEVYEEELLNLSSLSEGISMKQPQQDSVVTGNVQIAEKGVLTLAIPYETGWHAYVDGQEVEIHKVNYGFSGIYLEEGEHSIQMEYKCPGFVLGVWCSIFFFILTVFLWYGIVRSKRKNVEAFISR